ncbi:hypothetical protein KAR91_06870 [Candidatus Pacearchaeota archaeon]|nr:hypothetical protein [Candidatus Pacearchaeota archaeon]
MADIEMTVEEYEKARVELLQFFSVQGFLVEEKEEKMILRPRAPPDTDVRFVIDENFQVVSSSGSGLGKKKVAYLQMQITKQFQIIMTAMREES